MKRYVLVEEDLLEICYRIITEKATHDLKFGNFKAYHEQHKLLNRLIKLLVEE